MRADLGRTLLRARSTWRTTEVVRVLMVWAAPSLAALLVLCVLDNALHLPGWMRLTVALLWLLGTVGSFALVVAPAISRRRSYDATARMLEERLAIGDNVLINALQLRRDARSGEVPVPDAALREVAGEADEAVVRMEVARLWRLRPFVRAVRWGLVAAVLVAVYVLLFPEYAANALDRYSRPLSERAPLAAARVEVEPGDTRLVAGETLEVRATVSARRGELPGRASLRFRSPGEPWQTHSMTTVSREADEVVFVDRVGPLDASLEYRVESGDARTRVFSVEVVQPPRVVATTGVPAAAASRMGRPAPSPRVGRTNASASW